MKPICSGSFCLFTLLAAAQAQVVPVPNPEAEIVHPTISLSPAVVMLRGKPGQSATQPLTISNQLSIQLRFEVETQDVIVRDGKRLFVPAGQIASSIAAAAVVTPAFVVVPPGQTASVNVTLTAPSESSQRAVVVFFRAKMPSAGKDSVGFGASLGALITLALSDEVRVVSGPITVAPQSASANVSISEQLENTGSEPVMPKGVAAILDAREKRVAKVAFDPHRLLPGERAVFTVSSPAFLTPGNYRVLSSFEYEGKVLTNVGKFTVAE